MIWIWTSNFILLPFLIPCLSLVTAVYAQSNVTPAPVVDLGYAQYQGMVVLDKITNATHTEFLGMRYAASPTGMLASREGIFDDNLLSVSSLTGSRRFRAPFAPETTPGIQLANAPPSTCLQAGQGSSSASPFRIKQDKRATDVGASEDCLFLRYVNAVVSNFIALNNCLDKRIFAWHPRSTQKFTCSSFYSWVRF